MGDETLRMMKIQRTTLQQAFLGEIYQHMLIALEKLCNQRKFLSEMEKVHNKLKDNCQRKDLQIKCSEKGCDCLVKKRSHFKKYPLRKKYHAKPEKENFQENKMEIPQKKAIQRKDFKSVFHVQKASPLCQKLPKKGKGNKAS